MSELPFLIIGFLLLAFVIFGLWSFNDDVQKRIKDDRKGSARYRHKRSWFSDDH